MSFTSHVNKSPDKADKSHNSNTRQKNYQFHVSISFSSTIKKYKSPCCQYCSYNSTNNEKICLVKFHVNNTCQYSTTSRFSKDIDSILINLIQEKRTHIAVLSN